ncbi:hypothetical protein SDRG_14620 [Saprolegnia diclina VS20]|uniref:CinA C-terminal domain-containing protein n=1 Tax=Saprolegnia diclina (strain VS20) TaxID=1156394 RepID=T0Q2F2_SAPDV|nr:hypothetical protein SDRG_14620 [Saprolegnia diclina VS20]EQC27565.1 hypothetical protein SDRG_14620 [Saprolegnia diclina VS20]|eukprot:XP_008618985.1 hypothetical protein SDRG_14620 [Saprolegnia diclina VS20]
MAAAATVRAALQQIYTSKRVQCVVSVSGGGGSAVGEILGTCGASSTLLEVLVPYHRESMADFLQVPGTQLETLGFSSKDVATLMGKKALERGRRLVPLDDAAACIGIGCTAALVSSEPRRGSHRAFLSLHTVDAIHHFKLEMEKGARTRKEEDECVGHLVVLALAKAANVDMALQASLRELCTSHTGDSLVEDAPIATLTTSGLQLPTGPHETVAYLPPATILRDMPWRRMLVVPGSFNPMHVGHTQMAATAQAALAAASGEPPRRILYELSVRNADKGSVGGDALQARVQAIVSEHHAAVVLTNASLFLEKAALFPSCAFVIGADTAVRLLDLRYYDQSQEALWAALARISSLGCSFVVAGRQVGDAFVAAETVVSQVPAPFQSLFVPMPETSFRNDISSTALRTARDA